MQEKVCLVELNTYPNVVPLVSGYLAAYADADLALKRAYDHSIRCWQIDVARKTILNALLDENAAVYTFSCYVWNSGLIRYLARELGMLRPTATVLIGGPSVAENASDFISATMENVLVCTGEGEVPFRKMLTARLNGTDFADVRGLAFFRDGELLETEHSPGLIDLDEIPSPYLNGYFTGRYTTSTFETLRGCPYTCTFCYWGKAGRAKIRRFSESRVKEDLEWMARHEILYLQSADANWGMLKRDLDFARHIVRLKERYGYPRIVATNAAKNNPERSGEIIRIWHQAGIACSQAIGIQSTNPVVQDAVKRKNIKLSRFKQLFRELDDSDVPVSYDLIWPLPGDTLDGFRNTLNDLCNWGAHTILVYPAIVLPGTEMATQIDVYKIETISTADHVEEPVSDLRSVVSTRDVTAEETRQGVWASFAVTLLYNLVTLRRLGDHLHATGRMSWADLFFSFGHFLRQQPCALSDELTTIVSQGVHGELAAHGLIALVALDEGRAEFQELLQQYVTSAELIADDEVARVFFDLDLVGMPYIFANTPFDTSFGGHDFEFLEVTALDDRSARVKVNSESGRRALGAAVTGSGDDAGIYRVCYQVDQLRKKAGGSRVSQAIKAYGMVLRQASFLSTWKPIPSK